jgi:hypothetical protein
MGQPRGAQIPDPSGKWLVAAFQRALLRYSADRSFIRGFNERGRTAR